MKESNWVGLAVEFEVDYDFLYHRGEGNLGYLQTAQYCIDIRGTLEEFYAMIKEAENQSCGQELISLLKKGRDMGAAWVHFKEGEVV